MAFHPSAGSLSCCDAGPDPANLPISQSLPLRHSQHTASIYFSGGAASIDAAPSSTQLFPSPPVLPTPNLPSDNLSLAKTETELAQKEGCLRSLLRRLNSKILRLLIRSWITNYSTQTSNGVLPWWPEAVNFQNNLEKVLSNGKLIF
jgi:hypothetical protein